MPDRRPAIPILHTLRKFLELEEAAADALGSAAQLSLSKDSNIRRIAAPSSFRFIVRRLGMAGVFAAAIAGALPVRAQPQDMLKLEARAARVSIVRDNWGIPHVRGHTDADAVFGMMYAQAEDDFPRIEANYLASLGRSAEVEGEGALWQDLRQHLLYDPTRLRRLHASSPGWLRDLTAAWADGLNYYLATHPEVRPRLITRFEPWMALSFTEGSIGGDVAKVSLPDLEKFYASEMSASHEPLSALAFAEPTGSNGAAIAPARTANGHALLLINPHTSFYFRSEAKVTSDEGLNVYGAATWGQFFVYQGFNAKAGWMHTTSTADAVDEFAEQIVHRKGRPFYRHGRALRPVRERQVTLRYRSADGHMAERSFQTFRTHHGPVVRSEAGKWITVAMMDRPIAALKQSFLRTKATDLSGFLRVAALAANSSNDTLFADSKGSTALLLPQFLPRRDDRFDYTKPVDGSDPATDWKGDTPLGSLPQVVNPESGWIYNANDGPWWAAGGNSPARAAFPRYTDQVGENARTPHAVRVFSADDRFTRTSLIAAAYDPWLPTFERLVPKLVAGYDASRDGATRDRLGGAVALLRRWNYQWSADSVETSLAVFWGETLWARVAPAAKAAGTSPYRLMEEAPPADQLAALVTAIERLESDFGRWRVPWGEINRFQRLEGAIEPKFDDSKPSVPVPFTSAQWGSLAAFGAKRFDGSRKYYGWTGNSFVAVVEFGDRVRAQAVMAGGQSGDPASPHFRDQAATYAAGRLRDVYFHDDELEAHTARAYRPGEKQDHAP